MALPQVEFLDIKNHPPLPGTETECACMLSQVWLFATPWTAATRLLCPWDSPGKNTTVGCHFLLQGIFLTQMSNCISFISCVGRHSLPLSNLGSPYKWRSHNKRVTSILFSELLLYRLFLNNNQLRIICMPKRHIWRGGGMSCSLSHSSPTCIPHSQTLCSPPFPALDSWRA